MPGVQHVSSGFQGSREINTVVYDPRLIDRERMIAALKKAGTFINVAGDQDQ